MRQSLWKQVSPYLVVLAIIFLVFLVEWSGSTNTGCTRAPDLLTEGNITAGCEQPQKQISANEIGVGDLPNEARDTLQLIKQGGPFPYSKDGTVFSNYEGILPGKSGGYYHEYTVIAPGSPDRGAL